MEQWHQKLHNITSPDDVIICDTLVAFWHGYGDLSVYWNVINYNGFTRDRTVCYKQPITTKPILPGHIKAAMIHELTRYVELLNQALVFEQFIQASKSSLLLSVFSVASLRSFLARR